MFSNDIILSTTGKISRELLENTLEHKSSTNNIFMNVGAMGHVSMIGLGIAKNTTKKTPQDESWIAFRVLPSNSFLSLTCLDNQNITYHIKKAVK